MNERLLSIAPLVENYVLWTNYIEYIQEQIDTIRGRLEVASDPVEIYRFQGRIMALQDLLKTRDRIAEIRGKASYGTRA